jgi:hypothetical protein
MQTLEPLSLCIQGRLYTWYRVFSRKNEKKHARSFNFTLHYIDDVFQLNNSKLADFVGRIYPIEFDKMDTTDTTGSASYLDIHLEIESEDRLIK